MNIKELRELLAKVEAKWTEKDTEVMGKFEEQKICVLGEYGLYDITSAEFDCGSGVVLWDD